MSKKLVEVRHITYYNSYKNKAYLFVSDEDLKIGDIVLCDTRYGAALGIVKGIIENLSIDDFLTVHNTLLFEHKLKECRLLPDYKNIKLEDEEDMPF